MGPRISGRGRGVGGGCRGVPAPPLTGAARPDMFLYSILMPPPCKGTGLRRVRGGGWGADGSRTRRDREANIVREALREDICLLQVLLRRAEQVRSHVKHLFV